ncbi:hypothetical protein COW36_20200 [bacterium (Candidatus Blackallbacteria) CG17_big_fil_post_rev_8_21_14_2_50_48_46]|uniref:Uncharacterized protein n=1 Tax=bacterium (Candidatus Blackallbacteria) CG17_big_fil_post_rev_8_21_14_2_50_48_46 TaxID=2014261 RepID=A0A2M7FZD1_9BACT|nr:MAG: hypothetical protein COW64_22525 [bacterium (Candidatus Blackallbacteria) CG18_big_fil_WC_8_21_14_2_50_49_26]PIW14730.1 MAG: hypothetical protein COW36_20200 [bacterium (Candidatus Blackallbacteria) CG17_big_fil_post_rev_8_21_14_2_50_48_46]PIW50832.1 MAG: hypothetical protein COW20_01015 [bacterium (Candidatus Blackallbacteria) CG13_big_fil_rev_8_21_14_2_50_49_14]
MKDYLKHLFDFRNLFQPQKFKYINMLLFTSIAFNGYLQYFFRHVEAERSLYPGIGFTLILILYLFMVWHREKP